jgi:hypothetical protein
MTALHEPLEPPTLQAGPGAYQRSAPTVFAITLFLSALLLFAVQPMFTKMVLPRLGGSPAVWSVAMVFFQAALLVGYAYAHLIIRFLPLGAGALVHLLVIAVAALTLPIGIAAGFEKPPTNDIAFWLIGLLGVSIGLPFAVLSASAPLLQGWFAASGHPQSGNPYVLYSASNLGSLVALIAYPIAIEPVLSLNEQSRLWSAGFVGLAALIVLAGLFIVGRPSLARVNASAPVSIKTRLAWTMLAAIPAGLVIAVTSYITTDIAAAPFLWVVPLALYLMTFIGVFRDRPWIAHETVVKLVPLAVVPLALFLLSRNAIPWVVAIAFNLLTFFLLSLLCHSEVYRRRPEPARLTEFYLFVSFGGVIGGVFAALVAPHLFSHVYEYPILIVAALLVLPGVWSSGIWRLVTEAGPVIALAVAAVIAKFVFDVQLPETGVLPLKIALVALAVLMLLQRHRVVRFISLVVLAFVLSGLWQPGFKNVETARSFFGVHQVIETAEGSFRILMHGTTVHGAQGLLDDREAAKSAPKPLTYYYAGGPISQTIEAARAAKRRLPRVAVVGLGSGTLACYRRSGESWTFYEIDPEVVRIAKNPNLFRFMSACAPDADVVMGDARLTLPAARQRHNLIVIDAFSSDAIPVHLLTREAIVGYLSVLERDGVLVMHISNRHLELAKVVAAVGASEGLVTYVKQDVRSDNPIDRAAAIVAALARSPKNLGKLPQQRGWNEIKPDPRVAAWTDDYSNIFGAILRKKFGP